MNKEVKKQRLGREKIMNEKIDTYCPEFGLVIAERICTLHITIAPVVHNELFENDLSPIKLVNYHSAVRTDRLGSLHVHTPFLQKARPV
jgi:hypothetical protein